MVNQLHVIKHRTREAGGRFKREGVKVHLRMIHVDIWQKTTQYCKTIILRLKTSFKKEVRRDKWKKQQQNTTVL